MYSLWSNYIYIHRELWHYSKKPFLFQALEIVSQVLTGFFGILLPAGILLFLEQSSGFSGFALGTLVLFLCYAVVFVSHTFLQSRNAWQYTEFRTGFFTRRLLCHFMQIDYAVLNRTKNAAARRKSRRSHLQQLGRRGRHVPIRCHNLFFRFLADSLRRTDRNRPSGYHSSAACALGSAVSQLPPRGFLRSPPQRRSV